VGGKNDTVPKPWSGVSNRGLRHAENEGSEDVSTSEEDENGENYWDSEADEEN